MKWLRPIICAAACMLLGFFSGVSSFDAFENWYADLNKPSFSPPNWVFGPAWTALYLMMGIAVGLIWNRGMETVGVRTALSIFGMQFILNLLWSPIFFGMHLIFVALIVIVLMWIGIAVCIKQFWKINQVAAILMIPYLAWVSFATVLNFAFWRLN